MWKYNSVRPLLMKVCRGELDLEQRQRLKLSCATKGAGVSRGELNSPLTANTNRSYCLVGMRPDLPPFFFSFFFYAQRIPRAQAFGSNVWTYFSSQKETHKNTPAEFCGSVRSEGSSKLSCKQFDLWRVSQWISHTQVRACGEKTPRM